MSDAFTSEQMAEAEQGQVQDRLKKELEVLLTVLREETRSDAVTLLLYDAQNGQFCFPVSLGLQDEPTFEDPRMLPRTHQVAGKILKQKQGIVAQTVCGHPDMDGPFARRERIVSGAGFPLLHSGEAIGVIFVNYRRAHEFTLQDEASIEQSAERIAQRVQPHAAQVLHCHLHDSRDGMENTLDAIVQLVYSQTQRPIAFWLLERPTPILSIRASNGLTQDYVDQAKVDLTKVDKTHVIRAVVETGRAVEIRDIAADERFCYPEFAERGGWRSLLALPVKLHGQTRGVVEIFTFDGEQFDRINREALRYLTQMASVTLENAYRVRESQELALVARDLSKKPSFDDAMKLIVKSARRLTGADSSVIILHEKHTDRFVVGIRDPVETPKVQPRSRGLTREIIQADSGMVRIDDIRTDSRVNMQLHRERFTSMIGVRLQMEEERIGVLYIDGLRPGQFTDHDQALLQNLADYASVALGWAQMLLRPSRVIEQATADLYQLDARLDELCGELELKLGCDFSAIQLIRNKEIIETVYGKGIAEQWSGRSSHYLHEDPELRDIQADIALAEPPRAEILRGWDERFDRAIFDEFEHGKLARIFMPLINARDEDGNVVNDWFGDHCWVAEEGVQLEGETSAQRTVLRMVCKPAWLKFRIIGTVEVGFEDPEQEITLDLVNKMARIIADRAKDLRRPSLRAVLEVIVGQAQQLVNAQSATLHFPYKPKEPYVYQAQSGDIPDEFLTDHPPRSEGVGWEAMEENEPRFIPNATRRHAKDQLRKDNPAIWAEGIQAMAAFPLLVGHQKGVLYVHFHGPHTFREHEIGWISLFANRAADAIRHVMTYTQIRDRARQLATLQSIALSLGTNPEDPKLLKKIAGNTLNLLAADVVTIYEYSERQGRVLTPPSIAGRLAQKMRMENEIYSEDAPALLIGLDENKYVEENVQEDPILNKPDRHRAGNGFVVREKICSAAGILLRTGSGVVGVMFINYRRLHRFSDDEKKIIDALASSAAVAIRNRRVLERRQQDLVIITHQLQAPLASLISNLSAIDLSRMPAGEREYLDDAQALAEDALALCHGTSTAFARDAGRDMAFNASRIDVAKELRNVFQRLKATNDRDDMKLHLEMVSGFPVITINKDIFSSVVYSLFHNAMKYSDKGSKVQVACIVDQESGRSLIRIGSQGEPIDPEDQELIFERFRRGKLIEKTSRHHGGIGIGLWAARQLMQAVGGDLTVSLLPEEPRSSTFTIELPLETGGFRGVSNSSDLT